MPAKISYLRILQQNEANLATQLIGAGKRIEKTHTNYLGRHTAWLTPIRVVELVFHGLQYSFARFPTFQIDFWKKRFFSSYTKKCEICDFDTKKVKLLKTIADRRMNCC